MRPLRALVVLPALCCFAPMASAQEFPTKTVRVIAPFAPGGATDALARIVGQKLTERWHQQVIVDNRPGAGGNIGAELAARA
ncbi:MAG TPA: tripartite tricarboxylate transporter substrate-binding protein, partial [Burkholderiales bacterium]|nr:tripartite tricarboxylate transporter substrate-binding protein [Burkholderiales bacterium]